MGEGEATLCFFLFHKVGINRMEAGFGNKNSNSGKVMEKRKIIIVLLVLAAAICVIFVAAGVVKTEENIEIHTETGPIYNHFPDLPETAEIQWCSRTSQGIGLTTVKLYFFAFYDHDISNELKEMKIESRSGMINLQFVPEGIKEDDKWRQVENAGSAFQTGIKDTRKMNTTVYINEAGTVLYIEAIGE